MLKKTVAFLMIIAGVWGMAEGKISENTEKALIEAAVDARNNAYAPYSKYLVGAALLAKNGDIYKGANVENASYGLTNCAERSAIFSAVTAGEKDFVAIAVVTKDGQGFPCGGCRQVINEFNPDMVVFIANEDGVKTDEKTLREILPHAFGPHNLE